MKRFWLKIRPFVKKLQWRFFRTKIPVGIIDLETLSNDLLDIYQIPNLPSYHHAIATMIMHQPPNCDSMKMFHVKRQIHKAMANQVAYEVMQKIKEQDKAKADAKEA